VNDFREHPSITEVVKSLEGMGSRAMKTELRKMYPNMKITGKLIKGLRK